MKIYISSSWKNREQVRELALLLRDNNFEVYNFTDPKCRRTPEIPPEWFPEQFDPEKHIYSQYLNRPEWLDAVSENQEHIATADLIVLLLPCGVDSTADWALGVGMGKVSFVVGYPKAGERSPVHLWANVMLDAINEILPTINVFQNAGQLPV
jgi:hypothetical protein